VTNSGSHSPYDHLPRSAFWRTGVQAQPAEAIADLYRRKFEITPSTKIATAGSCFAQRVTRHLRERGFCVIDQEPAPPGLRPEEAAIFGYGLYSARYANIYTARHLRQLTAEAFDAFQPADAIWRKGDRYYDAMRPSVEPTGLLSPEAVSDHRRYHLRQVRQVILSAEVFVFTLGMTEAWIHAPTGTVYPTAPGVISGCYDPAIHQFKNFGFQEIYDDLRAFFSLAKRHNPSLKIVLTVSPVPMTATASGHHVLSATIYSKSVLRAVAGQLQDEESDIDYFPGYEIVTKTLYEGRFFEENARTVRAEGVAAAMKPFLSCNGADENSRRLDPPHKTGATGDEPTRSAEDVQCEDILLDALVQ
jgi:hypothetical protein